MADTIDISKVCRACLVDTGPFTNLFTLSSLNSMYFSEIFTFCTSVTVSETDDLPKQTCTTCTEILKTSLNFKQMAIKSDVILKQYLDKQHYQDTLKLELTEGNVNQISTDSNEIINNETLIEDDALDSLPQKIESNNFRKHKRRKFCLQPKDKSSMACPKCPKTFKKYENFEAHIRIHFGKKPDTKCITCGKVFSTLRNLNRHMQRHNVVRKYQCLTCGKRFAYQHVLKTHEMIHANIKKHACHLCNAKFVQLSNLKSDLYKHMRSHSSEKPYSCDYCDKSFKSDRFKIEHMRCHTGERPYACDICPKRFMSIKVMRNHRMIHTGEKPHKCQLCSQAFIQKCALDRHLKSHNKQDQQTGIENVIPTSSTYYPVLNPKVGRSM